MSESEYIYRYRPLKYLLEYGELENQHIHVSPSTGLNDPVEGYLDLYWHGDEVLWKNLFKHYLQCLTYIIIKNDGTSVLSKEQIPIFLFEKEISDNFIQNLNSIYDVFFSDKNIVKLVAGLSVKDKKVRRSELLFYLLCVHGLATNIVFKIILRISEFDENIVKSSKAIEEIFLEYEVENILSRENSVYDHAIDLHEQNSITDIFLNPKILENKNKNFLNKQFPKAYVEELEKLLYPPWHTACFSEDIKNASLWSHYADQHKGVCLKFRTHRQSNQRGMMLKTINGVGSTGKFKNFNFTPLYKINYENKYPEVDFFNSLGQLPQPKMLNEWHGDGDGKFSARVKNVGSEEWRNQYWNNFYKSTASKLRDWRYEEEQRLIIVNDLIETTEDRLIEYKFSDLEAVIFGVRTPLEAKLQILNILENKCHKLCQYHIQILQASYSHVSGEIGTTAFKTHFTESIENGSEQN